MNRSLADYLAPAVFVLGLLVLALGYGFFAARLGWFPATQLNAAETVALSVWRAYFRPEWKAANGLTRSVPPVPGPVVVHDPKRIAPGVTLIVGYRGDGFGAWLVDADGRELHRWQITFSAAFPEAPHLQWRTGDGAIAWHGAHLFPNGDLLLNFQDNNFPYGSGLVKIDRDSRLLWALPRNTHHDVTVAEDGTLWVPSLYYRPDGLPSTPNLKPGYYEDTILHLSPNGEILDEISVLDAVAKGAGGLLSINYRDDLEVASEDPLHVNNVEPLPAALAPAFPMLAAGDLMVSLRSTNTVAVIDPKNRAVKWVLAGSFAKQHDPDFLPNGHILLFDNQGGSPTCGGSRILEIDPATQAVVWHYDGCGDRPFHSDLRGTVQLLSNGNVLVGDSLEGRVFEVTRDPEPKLVWEYFNLFEQNNTRARVGIVTHAERFSPDSLTFLDGPNS